MDSIEVTVGSAGNNERLEIWLPKNVPGLSRNKAAEMIKSGLIKVNGDNGNKGRKLKNGDKVLIIMEKTARKKGYSAEPEVIFKNKDLLIINKPAGIPCHPIRLGETGTLLNWLAEKFPEVMTAGEIEREGGLLHRLDIDTSGAVAFARSKESFEKFKPFFAESGADKYYLAICEDKQPGLPEAGEKMIIDTPIARHPTKAGVMIIVKGKEDKRGAAMQAKTEVRTIAKGNRCALVEAKISRGRMHQIRLHLSSIGHPIIGDAVYGKKDADITRHALHAHRLVIKAEKINATAPMHDDMKRLCEKRGIKL